MKTYCFDIDGIICTTKNSLYELSKPNLKVIKLINTLYKKNKIIIFTARYMGRTNNNKRKATIMAKKMTINQLKKWNLNYHKIYFAKPHYDYFIDDKSIFVNKKLNIKIQNNLKKIITL